MRRALLLSGTVLLLVRPAFGQRAAARSSPPGRAHHALFYDAARQRVLLTGGTISDSLRRQAQLNDLWSFDGTAWMPLASSGDSLSGTRVVTDARKRVYSFGGFRNDTSIGELRVLDNDHWRRIGTHPSVVTAEAGFVFDSARNRFVAFGGGSAPRPDIVSEVWEYDGARWMKSPATPPPPRLMHSMVYDARRKSTVVFGGLGVRSGEQSAPIFGDTWEFDGARWTQIRSAGPRPRLGAGAAYDSKRGLMLVFGGSNEQGALNDLWSWDGTSWRKLAGSGPEPRVFGSMAYDQQRDRLVLFGGRGGASGDSDLSDTWEWDGAMWRRIAQ